MKKGLTLFIIFVVLAIGYFLSSTFLDKKNFDEKVDQLTQEIKDLKLKQKKNFMYLDEEMGKIQKSLNELLKTIPEPTIEEIKEVPITEKVLSEITVEPEKVLPEAITEPEIPEEIEVVKVTERLDLRGIATGGVSPDLALVDNEIYEEGQELPSGERIVEITADSIIIHDPSQEPLIVRVFEEDEN